MKKIVTLLATALYLQVNAQVCFNPATTYTLGTGYNPYAVNTADFNNDGNLDLVIADNVPYQVSVFLNNGDGTFGTVNNIGVGVNPRSIACADYDGDGNIDIATSDATTNKVSVLLGDGAGNFATVVDIPTGNHPLAIVSGDFDNDGMIDLATCNDMSNDVSILLNTNTTIGTVSFSAPTSFTVGTAPTAITTADFDGDGFLDIATANLTSSDVSILLNTNVASGTASFTVNATISVGQTPLSIINDDFNNDGYTDIAVASQNGNVISVLLYQTSGALFATPITTSVTDLQAITSGDYNNDGNEDIASVDIGLNTVGIFLGVGTGNFTLNTKFTVGNYPYNITSADLDGDGMLDLAVVNINSGDVSVLLNNQTLPSLTITPSNASICTGQTCTLTASGASTYTWTSGITNGVAFTPSVTTTDTVKAVDAVGCSNIATIDITVNDLPTVTVSSSTVDLCTGSSATLTAASGTAITYTWSTTENGISIVVSPTNTATYTVIGTDVNGCQNTNTVTQTVSMCTTGIENYSNYQVTVYPNPSNGLVTLSLANVDAGTLLYVTNMIGEQIVKTTLKDLTTNFDFTYLQKGVYMITVTNGQSKHIEKLIIE